MKLIVGLGNPGPKYRNNRHNIGYMVIDDFVRQEGLGWRYNGDWLCYFCKSQTFVAIKPATFMNKAGEAVFLVSNFFKIKNKDILVACDDLDFDLGKIKLAFNGLSAGHHGVDSVIESLGSIDFGRLRIGIGHPSREASDGKPSNMRIAPNGKASPKKVKDKKVEVSDFVLSDFNNDELDTVASIVKKSIEAIKTFINSGIDATMNRFN